MQELLLHCVTRTFMLQSNTKISLGSILMFLCIATLHLIMKKMCLDTTYSELTLMDNEGCQTKIMH